MSTSTMHSGVVHEQSSVAGGYHKPLEQAKAALPVLHSVTRRSAEDVSKTS
jgi:hypothetical protein